MMRKDDSLRVLIHARVTDIPGDKLQRPTRLAQDFSMQVRERPFNNDLKAACHDSEHILPRFDSDHPVKAWFIIDFNVKGALDREAVLALPHEVYLASRQGDSWVFTLREQWVDKVKNYASMYKWGANLLQK